MQQRRNFWLAAKYSWERCNIQILSDSHETCHFLQSALAGSRGRALRGGHVDLRRPRVDSISEGRCRCPRPPARQSFRSLSSLGGCEGTASPRARSLQSGSHPRNSSRLLRSSTRSVSSRRSGRPRGVCLPRLCGFLSGPHDWIAFCDPPDGLLLGTVSSHLRYHAPLAPNSVP